MRTVRNAEESICNLHLSQSQRIKTPTNFSNYFFPFPPRLWNECVNLQQQQHNNNNNSSGRQAKSTSSSFSSTPTHSSSAELLESKAKMLMQKKNPKKHKFSKHTHTHTKIYIHIRIYWYTYMTKYIQGNLWSACTCNTYTQTFIHFFFFFFAQAPGKGGKEGTKRDRGTQVRARYTKTQSGLPHKVLGGQKILVCLFQVMFLSVNFFAGHFRKQNICRSGHIVMFLLKCLLVLFFLNFIYLFIYFQCHTWWLSDGHPPCITQKIKYK